MRIIEKTTSTVLGTVITNHSMSLDEACEMAGVDLDGYDIAELHLSTYEEAAEIAGAEECARESVAQGIGPEGVTRNVDGDKILGSMGDHDSMLDGDYKWLKEKFGHVSHSMERAYRSEWNSALEAAE
jgi:hypothetical protein